MTEKKALQDKGHCPENCPFLEINYCADTQKIPYHCELFETYLAFDGKVTRCSECVGHERSIREEGLNFINAYRDSSVDRNMTKLGFSKLFPAVQAQFVSFLKRVGRPVGIPANIHLKSAFDLPKVQRALMEELTRNIKLTKEEPKEYQEFKALLKKQTDDIPDALDSKTCKFLLNLFSVLDSSEKAALMQILRNPHTLDVFLKRLRFMPKDNNLLKNIRLELPRLLPTAELENLSIDNAKAIDYAKQESITKVK